jgi:hypothetical protein
MLIASHVASSCSNSKHQIFLIRGIWGGGGGKETHTQNLKGMHLILTALIQFLANIPHFHDGFHSIPQSLQANTVIYT